MKVKFSQFARDTYPSLLNMPADNASPGMLYLVIDSQYADPVICVKQWDKSWGAGEKGKSGFTAEKWENVIAVFDRDKTEAAGRFTGQTSKSMRALRELAAEQLRRAAEELPRLAGARLRRAAEGLPRLVVAELPRLAGARPRRAVVRHPLRKSTEE